MKVLCIKNGLWECEGYPPDSYGPKFGEICTVLKEDEIDYFLKEYQEKPVGLEEWFNKKRFIPISDIDETELIKERETQHA